MSSTLGASLLRTVLSDGTLKILGSGLDKGPIIICHEYEHETELYLGLLAAVKQGDISEDRINESVKRIVKAKLLHLN